MRRHRIPRRHAAPPRERRGVALLLVLLLVMALGALATSAILLGGNATLMSKMTQREQRLRYAAEAGLQLAKSRLNYDPTALPDTGVATLVSRHALHDADGVVLPDITVDVYAGPSGSTSGQDGRFSSVVAVASDASGNRMIRRLELAQESFAKFAYWSNRETNNGNPIYFGGGDQLWGPVWSNDEIRINSSVTFNDDVGTARTISGKNYGTFRKGYGEKQQKIELPSTDILTKLAGYAAVGGYSYVAPTNGSETAVRLRIEFVSVDLNGDGDATDADEGFFRVYEANPGEQSMLRGDWQSSSNKVDDVVNCGDWHTVGGVERFFPVSVHNDAWFETLMRSELGLSSAYWKNTWYPKHDQIEEIMRSPGARCYPAGDPHLAATDRIGVAGYTNASREIGGDSTTFTPGGAYGTWRQFTMTPDPRVAAARPADARYLHPLHRGLNPGSRGVIHVKGTVALSGDVRGRVTVYVENGHAVVIDDLRYRTDPGLGSCQDVLGIISDRDIVVADNAINTPKYFGSTGQLSGGQWRSMDETKDLYVHGVMMALKTSFRVEKHDGGPDDATKCEGTTNGRGCLYLTGGIIQEARGAVGLSSGEGYTKRYAYDRCAVINPPPYFPTTGRFADNRYYELDPVGFDVKTLFQRITPNPN